MTRTGGVHMRFAGTVVTRGRPRLAAARRRQARPSNRRRAQHDRPGRRLRREPEGRLQAAVEEINKSGALKYIVLEAVIEDDASTRTQGITSSTSSSTRTRSPPSSGRPSPTPPRRPTRSRSRPRCRSSRSRTRPGDHRHRRLHLARLADRGAGHPAARQDRSRRRSASRRPASSYGNDDAFTKSGYDGHEGALAGPRVQVAASRPSRSRDQRLQRPS